MRIDFDFLYRIEWKNYLFLVFNKIFSSTFLNFLRGYLTKIFVIFAHVSRLTDTIGSQCPNVLHELPVDVTPLAFSNATKEATMRT